MAKQYKGLDLDEDAMSAPRGKNHLLVIAIDQYVHCPGLNNCVKDARDFIEVLTERYQFEPENIDRLFNEAATRPNIHASLKLLKTKVKSEDNLVLYFSGHGETEDGVGYWVPVDAHPENDWEFISTNEIRQRLNVIQSFHTFLIVDACFSGALFNTYRSVTPGYETKRSRWGLAASHSRERALDGMPGENSPFAKLLLKTLRENTGNLGVQTLATAVIEEIQAATEGKQTPVFKPLSVQGDESGQYVFRVKADEAADWAACRAADRLEVYQAFLAKYPAGAHAEAARSRVADLEEAAAWAAAGKANTILSYYQYNQRYPNGKHHRESLEAIRKLEEEQFWNRIKQRNSLAGFLEYKDNYPQGRYLEEADTRIQAIIAGQQEPLAWQQAKNKGTPEAYEAYLEQYPAGAHAVEAREAVAERKRQAAESAQAKQELDTWHSARQAGTEAAYRKYLDAYPQGRYAVEAASALAKSQKKKEAAEAEGRKQEQEPLAWQQAKNKGTPEAYEAYLEQYPAGAHAVEAQEAVAERKRQAAESAQAKQELDTWHSAHQAGTEAAYRKYLDAYPQGRYAVEAASALAKWQKKREAVAAEVRKKEQEEAQRQRQEQAMRRAEEAWKTAEQTGSINTIKSFLRQYPHSSQAAEARKALDKLQAARRQEQGRQIRRSLSVVGNLLLMVLAVWQTAKFMGNGQLDNQTDTSTALDSPTTATFANVTLGGKTYQTISLDGLTWLAQNLDYEIEDSWCYDDDPGNCAEYGRLYTWEAAKKACAAVGWRLPTDQEWRDMAKQFGGADDDAGDGGAAAYKALIDRGSSGFSALLGGFRSTDGSFSGLGDLGYYWSATEYGESYAWDYYFGRYLGKLSRGGSDDKEYGLACRCVQ